MIWHKATLSAMILASMAVDSTANPPSTENVDVIILGAGAAGASAARQLEMHNDDNPRQKISYYVLEAKNRVGGRIMDKQLGAEVPPSRYSGGYESKDPNGRVWTSAPQNEGCKCRGIDCPNFRVEMGMGWFQGTKGIDIESCPAESQRQGIDLSTQLREEKVEEDGHFKTALYLGKHPAVPNQGNVAKAAAKKPDCDVCHAIYNKHFAISQGKAPDNHGNLEDPLKVHCAGEGGMSGEKYSFLKEGHYYGKNARGQIEMKKIEFEEEELPGFKQNQHWTPDEFLYKFDQMMFKCVNYEAYQFYYQWWYQAYWESDWGKTADAWGRYSTPFYSDDGAINSTSWKDFDKGFHNMPDRNPFHEESLIEFEYTDGNARVIYCDKFHNMVKRFLKKNDEISLNGKKLYNWYKNFDQFSSFMDGQDISFMNFGDDGTSRLGYEHAFSIDQRGLKTVVESVMPNNNRLKLKHKVKKVHWKHTAKLCSKQYPVLVTAKEVGKKGLKRYCAKKVISTVSHGALAEPNNKINPFMPKISVAKSPFKSESGDLIKLYFRFPEKFWNSEDGTASDYISFMMEENFKINKSEGKVRGEYFYNLDRWYRNLCDPNNPDKFCDTRSLFTFLTSHELKVMGLHDNNVSDQEFSDKIWYILEPLRQQYGDQFLEPDCWQFHDWKNDPQFRGAYGVWKPGSTYIDHQDFFQPRKNNDKKEVLWLSGEASCLNHWGTNEGAYEAGARDAKRVINSLLGIDEEVFSICDMTKEYEMCTLDDSCLDAITPDWSWL